VNGPEHYREAEELLRCADFRHGRYEDTGTETDLRGAELMTGQAQVHAVLALAVATAQQVAAVRFADWVAWSEVVNGEHTRERSGQR
jgi:hypothetical protein